MAQAVDLLNYNPLDRGAQQDPFPFYAELRTKQQLGYIVQCAANEIDGVRGIVFVVQSNVQPPQVRMGNYPPLACDTP